MMHCQIYTTFTGHVDVYQTVRMRQSFEPLFVRYGVNLVEAEEWTERRDRSKYGFRTLEVRNSTWARWVLPQYLFEIFCRPPPCPAYRWFPVKKAQLENEIRPYDIISPQPGPPISPIEATDLYTYTHGRKACAVL